MKKLEAIVYFKSKSALAKFLGVPPSNVSQWKNIPPEYQKKIEEHTGGLLKADIKPMKMRYMCIIETDYIDKLKKMAEMQNASVVAILRKAITMYWEYCKK